MGTNTNPTHVVTGKVRLSYAHLTQPYKSQLAGEDDKAKYSTTLLIPKTDTATKAKIDAAIQAAGERALASGRIKKGTPIDKLPTPIHDGDGYKADGYTEYGPECRGMWVLTASCKADRPPFVVDRQVQPIIDATKVYSGMWGNVNVNFFAYAAAGKKGIGCGLNGVQKVRDDTPLVSRVTAEEAFSAIADDPVASMFGGC